MALTTEQVQDIATQFCRQYRSACALEYQIYPTQKDVYEKYRPEDGPFTGAYYSRRQTVALVAANLRDERELAATLKHEVLGHFGLNTFEPGDKRKLLKAIGRTREDPAFAEVWRAVDQHYSKASPLLKAEEVFAFLAEGIDPEKRYDPEQGRQALEVALTDPAAILSVRQLFSITTFVAHGMELGTRVQLNFPIFDNALFSKETHLSKLPTLGGEEIAPASQDSPTLQSYHEKVASRLIEQLKQGTAPWQRPIVPGSVNSMFPYNPTTGAHYRGMNMISLMAENRQDQRWMTYRQAAAADGQVRKGEKGTPIQFWTFTKTRDVLDADGKPVLDEKGEKKQETVRLARPTMRFATVFNAEQIDGLKETATVRPAPTNTLEHANALLAATGADIRHDQVNKMFYRPSTDTIHLPRPDQFRSTGDYYATAFHEVAHWSGAQGRLNRDLSNPFGSEGYAKEELRAEIASLMISQELNLPHDPSNHASYVGSWIKVLQDDPREIFRAASDAEQIRGFVMGMTQQQEQTVQVPTEAQAAAAAIAATGQPRNREYLNVPYADKEAAKALGAKWDRSEKSWFVPDGVDPSPFAQWAKPNEPAIAIPGVPSPPLQSIAKNATLIAAGMTDAVEMARELAADDCEALKQLPLASNERAEGAAYIKANMALDRAYAETVRIRYPDLEESDIAISRSADRALANPRVVQQGVARDNAVETPRPITARPGADENEEIVGLRVIQDSAVLVRALSLAGGKGRVLTGQFATEDLQAYQRLPTDSPQRADALALIGENAALDATYAATLRVLDAAVAGAAQDAFQAKPDAAVPPATQEKMKTSPKEEPARSYLLVPYAEREQARAAGARWDAKAKSWYAGPKADHEALAKWEPVSQKPSEATPSPRQEFAARLMDAGARITGEHPIMDGKTHRIQVADDKSWDRSGFYVGYVDGIKPAGYFKNNRTGEEFRWKAKGYTLTADQKEAFVQAATLKLQQRERELAERQEQRAAQLTERRETLKPVNAETRTPYLVAKNIPAFAGVYTDDKAQTLFVPLVDAQGKQWSEQYIHADGVKRLAANARKDGCFHVVDGYERLRSAKVFVLAEGYSTAATIHDSLNARIPVAVVSAVDAGNLTAVAKSLKQAFPDTPIVIAGEDDRLLQERKNMNPGRTGALKAAEAVQGVAVFPTFAPTDDKKLTDFNDLRAQSVLGLEGLQRQLMPVIEKVAGLEELEEKIARVRTNAIKKPRPGYEEEGPRKIRRSIA
jgi:antirestriction protein ArdC/phage/plasmid primase-like uncharacterized protein